ncbi:hypothetical protein J5J86_07205 [Aquabacter sp. L1I39]|uniref:hypothetical protein n=1 Tax=Aquabacter sp. L1I39 TaxID=2820278 RepID=UPI001ADCB611|nr:hypothetical protein [Aquabacter sp. L1I39]QTL05081.1 hypothetical protein J5J86_07205 [Aquabacter sp. L1I39]
MSEFEVVSRLFTLLLGLAIAEVLKGFARVVRIRLKAEDVRPGAVRIGWLVPLLGTMMVLDQVTFWINFQHFGPLLPGTYPSLISMMVLIGGYFALSTLVFPTEPKQWADFDDYYMLVRRTVAGGVLAVNMFTLCAVLALELYSQTGVFDAMPDLDNPLGSLLDSLSIPALIALLFVRGKRWNLILLALVNLLLLGQALPF